MAAKTVFSVFRKGLFDGKAAIVTGGGTGIGKAITEELLYLGCQVMIASRKIDRLASAADEIKRCIPEESSGTLEYMQCNIRQEDQVADLIQTTLKRFGKIDFVVNNGGGQFVSPMARIPLKGWNAVIETNLTGTFLMCREVYDKWMEKNGGVIVNIIADMWKGFPGMGHSGAARAGVDNLTKTLAIEWAPSGVRINAVAPGSSIYSETAAANYGSLDVFNIQKSHLPTKRLGSTEEVSAAVVFLLSPAAAFISGETIKVDGAHSLCCPSLPWEIPDHDKLPAYTWEKDAKDHAEKMEKKKKSKL